MATIIKRNGKFSVRIRVSGNPTINKTFIDRRSAQTWAMQTEDDIKRGVYDFGNADLPTLSQALQKYGKQVTPRKRGADKERHVLAFLNRLNIARKQLDQVQASEISKLRDAWLKDVSPSTIQKRLALLSHLFSTAAKEWGYTVENPLLRVTKPKVSNQRTRTISKAELDAIISAAPNDTLKAIAPLAWHTAARLGELVTLQWQNVDLIASVMTFPLTKNGSARTVPLVPAATALLESLKPKTEPHERLTGPVFDTTSMSMTKAWIAAVGKARKAYEASCKEQGLTPDSRWLVGPHFHDLRHSAITRLAEHGLSTLELAAISGHKSLQMLGRYTHIRAEGLAQKLAGLERAALKQEAALLMQ